MQRNLLHYERALYLRRKKGYSYSEIMAEVPVAKSTLSLWLRGLKIKKKHQARLQQKQVERWRRNFNLGEWNRKKRQDEILTIREQATAQISPLTDRELFVAGVMLYWAEGAKGNGLSISNADPVFIEFIMHWFRKSLHISEDRFVASLHYHEGQNEQKMRIFWSELTGIPLDSFRKGFCKPPGTGHRTHHLQWGVIRITVRKGSDLFHQIMGWKNGLINDVISGINNK